MATSSIQTLPLTGRIDIWDRLWRIYIDGVKLDTYVEGHRHAHLPDLIIGEWFWRHPEWDSLPSALKSFIMTIWLKSVRYSTNNLQEIRVETLLSQGCTAIWVKNHRGRVVTDEQSDWYLELVSSMLGRPIQLRPYRQIEP